MYPNFFKPHFAWHFSTNVHHVHAFPRETKGISLKPERDHPAGAKTDFGGGATITYIQTPFFLMQIESILCEIKINAKKFMFISQIKINYGF